MFVLINSDKMLFSPVRNVAFKKKSLVQIWFKCYHFKLAHDNKPTSQVIMDNFNELQ